MGFFQTILIVLFAVDFFVWWGCARLARRGASRAVRLALHGFCLAQIIFLAGMLRVPLPQPVYLIIYIWHLLVAPVALVIILFWLTGRTLAGILRFFKPPPAPASTPAAGGVSRREFLGAVTALTPPVLTFPLSAFAATQLSCFRIRRLTVSLPTLPAALDGMTIALLADLHLGQFTGGAVVEKIIQATNDLQADLTLFAGDLINSSSLTLLPMGIEVLRRLRGPLVLVEGNHDVGDNGTLFDREVKAAGFCLLLDETVTLSVRGVPVQVLGARWDGPKNWQNRGDERGLAASMDALLRQRNPAAFPILLAHHPHAWDYCGDIPLTLAGHTHGGQLMVDEHHGIGPMMFRYWSGLYTLPATAGHPAKALVVSNGVGNWFPLRTGAPAEIIHLTLRRG